MVRRNRFIVLIIGFFFLSSFSAGCDKIKQILPGKTENDSSAETQEQPRTKTTSPKQTIKLPIDGIVRINNWVLTKNDFQERLVALKQVLPNFDENNQDARKMVLEEIISQQLIVNDAKVKGIDKQKEVAAAVEEFEKTLLVRENAKLLVGGVMITEEDARKFYDENPNNFKVQEEWKLREIVVADQLKANELLLKAMKGDDFAELAKKNSVSDSAANGGDLGFVANVPFFEMANAIANLEEEGVSNVFQGPQGFYIMKVEEKRGGRMRDFDEVKEQLQKELIVMEQQKVIMEHVQNLRKSADIEVNEANLE